MILLKKRIRDVAMRRLGHEIIGFGYLLGGILLLVAQEAKSPIREVEAAEDDDRSEYLFEHSVSIVNNSFDFILGLELLGCGVGFLLPGLLFARALRGGLVFTEPGGKIYEDENTYHGFIAEFLHETIEDHGESLRRDAGARHFFRVAAHARLPDIACLDHARDSVFAAVIIPVF
jgi:hypothetical protein